MSEHADHDLAEYLRRQKIVQEMCAAATEVYRCRIKQRRRPVSRQPWRLVKPRRI